MEELTHLFSVVCGQGSEHTWAPGGTLLPCCQRCTGLYTGALVAALLHLAWRPRFTRRFLEIHGAFLLVMIPFGYHWLPQGPALRAITGVLFGFGLVTFLRLPLGDFFPAGPSPASPAADRRNIHYFIRALLAVLLVPALGTYGNGLVCQAMALAVSGGAVVFALLIAANLALGLSAAAQGLWRLTKRRADA